MRTVFERMMFNIWVHTAGKPEEVMCEACEINHAPGEIFEYVPHHFCTTCQNTRVLPIPISELRGTIEQP